MKNPAREAANFSLRKIFNNEGLMTNLERRVIELEFFITIQRIYLIKKDMNFLTQFLVMLQTIEPFDIKKVVHYANRFNIDILWYPYEGEIVGVLYKYSKIPFNIICKTVNISRPTGYKLAQKYLEDPIEVLPKVPIEDIHNLKNVVKAFNTVKEGI